jgi:hypothetical protein
MAGMPRALGLTGVAGEYFVVAEMSLRGWLATVTIKNSPGIDVLGRHPETGSLVSIQTKTASAGFVFRLKEQDERRADSANDWYALVGLTAPDSKLRPTIYVVPRDVVSKQVAITHAIWMCQPGKAGQPHKDSQMRTIRSAHVERFKDAWELLHLPSSDVPFELTEPVVEAARRGCPDDEWLAQYATTHPFYAALNLAREWNALRAAI